MTELAQTTLVGGQILMAHRPEDCFNKERCTIHNPSDHHMSEWPQNWRGDRGFMERLCPHGVGHPDPDQMYYLRETRGGRAAEVEGIHGCDGCCAAPLAASSSELLSGGTGSDRVGPARTPWLAGSPA